LAHDINGFKLGMTIKEVQAVAHQPLRSLGGGQYEATVTDVNYNFGFSILGHLYRIDSQQNLSRFIPDGAFARTLTEKLSAKYGPPQSNQLPGGPAFWQFVESYQEPNGPMINQITLSLSAMLLAGWNQPVSLNLKLMDFRIERRDLTQANAGPRSRAEDRTKF
jgi:hypothetical protein